MDKSLWLPDAKDERINIPGTVTAFNWTYRMPCAVEELVENKEEKLSEKEIKEPEEEIKEPSEEEKKPEEYGDILEEKEEISAGQETVNKNTDFDLPMKNGDDFDIPLS